MALYDPRETHCSGRWRRHRWGRTAKRSIAGRAEYICTRCGKRGVLVLGDRDGEREKVSG